MRKILFIALLVFTKQINAQTWVTIPDANFVTYLQTNFASAMHGDSLNISSTLVTTTQHSVDVFNLNISNLTGIQYFTSLTFLNCGGNSLATLPNLPNTLTTLQCYNNQLTTLPSLPSTLYDLDCANNHLSNLPTLPNSLFSLQCYSNQLTNLPSLPNSLGVLICWGNLLSNLPLIGNSLISLGCNNNNLTSIPALPNSLQYLVCGHNSLTSLPSLPSLKWLWCDSNNISCFPILPNSIDSGELFIDPNPYTCLPNYITAMNSTDLAKPLCAAGNINGCAVTGIEQYNEKNNISVYPNPSMGQLTIDAKQNTGHIAIYNPLGEKLYEVDIDAAPININLTSSGVYQLVFITAQGVITKKVVVTD